MEQIENGIKERSIIVLPLLITIITYHYCGIVYDGELVSFSFKKTYILSSEFPQTLRGLDSESNFFLLNIT